MDSREQLVEEIRKHVAEKQLLLLQEAYGALRGKEKAHAYIKQIIRPPEGGTFVELYGCSYLYKGFPTEQIIRSIGIVKRTIMATIRFVLQKPFVYIIPLLFVFRKKLIRSAIFWLSDVYSADLAIGMIRVKEFNVMGRELIRVGLELCRDIEDEEYRTQCERLVYFLTSVLEFDSAYRVRFQDIMSELDKDNNARSEVLRLIDILIERDPKIHAKFRMVRSVVWFLLLFKDIQSLAQGFIESIQSDKIKPDVADIYFSLCQGLYNVQGLPAEERIKRFEAIDKERGHINVFQEHNETTIGSPAWHKQKEN